jgi:diguanylate cyclase (GGDEF)-like protein
MVFRLRPGGDAADIGPSPPYYSRRRMQRPRMPPAGTPALLTGGRQSPSIRAGRSSVSMSNRTAGRRNNEMEHDPGGGTPVPAAVSAWTPYFGLRRQERFVVPWGLLVLLAAVILVLRVVPAFAGLRQSEALFPVWMHIASESFAITVAILVFAVAWHTYQPDRLANVLILACGCLGMALLDFGHMLSYKGMPDFVTPASPQKAIVFWLAARSIECFTLFAVAVRPWPPLRSRTGRYALLVAVLAFVAAAAYIELARPDRAPVMYVSGEGLTATKVHAEYALIAVLAATAAMMYLRPGRIRRSGSADLFTAILIIVLSELCFTLYENVNEVFSLIGHVYKVVAFMFLYRAAFVAGVREPLQRLSQEVAERRRAEARIEFMAYHDALTQLPNRVLIRDRFDVAAARAHRSGSGVAMIYVDLDNFKTINDSLGHAVGDRLLQTVAGRFTQLLRESDAVARLGGDEFLMILGDVADGEAIAPVLEKLMELTRAPVNVDGHMLHPSLSAGVAIYPDDGGDFDTLLQKADTAMYQAKAMGRNAYRFYDPEMNAGALEKLELRSDLALALERGEFRLHYQPQVDLRTGAIVGVEALLRWQHPQRGLLLPAGFIDIAEESGLIVPIGEWVLQTACRQAAAWRQAGFTLTMAVNISAVQFQRGAIDLRVPAILSAAGLPAEGLELELTESILIHHTDKNLATVRNLNAAGVRLAIDDFGTGYSSLSYLKRFAVDRLKIDRSFVREMVASRDDAAIVRAVIEVARSLGLCTVAEGVESVEVREALRGLQCDQAQGFYFARPMTAELITSRLLQAAPEPPPLP